jgi:hypothetical protein
MVACLTCSPRESHSDVSELLLRCLLLLAVGGWRYWLPALRPPTPSPVLCNCFLNPGSQDPRVAIPGFNNPGSRGRHPRVQKPIILRSWFPGPIARGIVEKEPFRRKSGGGIMEDRSLRRKYVGDNWWAGHLARESSARSHFKVT